MSVDMREIVCVCVRESGSECVCVSVCVWVYEAMWVLVYEKECACLKLRILVCEREFVCVLTCITVCQDQDSVCVCVCSFNKGHCAWVAPSPFPSSPLFELTPNNTPMSFNNTCCLSSFSAAPCHGSLFWSKSESYTPGNTKRTGNCKLLMSTC
jgi:hypothetical protein